MDGMLRRYRLVSRAGSAIRSPRDRRPRSSALRPASLAGLVVLALVSGCLWPTLPSQSPREMLPATPVPGSMLEPLGSALILRAYSGPFVDHEQRDLQGWPDIIVFDDGSVVVSTSPSFEPDPEYVSIQLDAEEFAAVAEELQEADLRPLAAGGQREGSFCIDCPTTIIRTDVGGDTIEIAAAGLITSLDPDYVANLPYPANVIALDRLLNTLAERARAAGKPYDGSVPEVPIAPCMCG